VRGKEIRPAAVIGHRQDRTDHILVAHEAAEPGLHPVDGQQDTGRHAVGLFEALIEGRVGVVALAHLSGETVERAKADPDELVQFIADAALVAVGGDGAGGIGRPGQSLQPALTDALRGSFGGKGLFPRLEAAAVIAALGGLGGGGSQGKQGGRANGCQGGTKGQRHGTPRVNQQIRRQINM
jgi:hypothetical protein